MSGLSNIAACLGLICVFASVRAEVGGVVPDESRRSGIARWIDENPEPEYDRQASGLLGYRNSTTNSLPKNTVRFRRLFRLGQGEIVSAEVRVCGLGAYQLWVNGRPVDENRMLAPGWSRPEHRVLFDRYDLRQFLHSGDDNAIGLWLAPGYSDDYMRWCWRWLRPKCAWLELDVRFADGRSQRVVTDESWSWTDATPIGRVSLYHGEQFDARRDDPAWACACGSSSEWKKARVLDCEGWNLVENPGPAIRLARPVFPVSSAYAGDDRWILDFGTNRAGVVEMTLAMPRGHVVELSHAEDVSGDGKSLDRRSLRTARATDSYVFSGLGVERYRPRFTYHGFRYVEVRGIPFGKMTKEAFRAWEVSADVEETASFECSDTTLNWLFESARRSIRSNTVSFSSDCPMRDERTPCLMDSNCSEDMAMLCFGLKDFYVKWLGDAVRYEEGVYDKVRDNDNPDWEGTQILMAERMLRHYAATNAVRREYGALCKVIDGLRRRQPSDGIWRKGFGDWCPPGGHDWESFHSSVAVVNTAFLAAVYRSISRLARIFGDGDGAAAYERSYVLTTNAFANAFLRSGTSVCADGLQADYVVTLALDIVPHGARPWMIDALAKRIAETDRYHIGTGGYGTRYIGEVLLDSGLEDLWWKMMHQREAPGFEYMRLSGATALWEQWDPDGEMNCHNHRMRAGAATCLLTHLAGIRLDGDGGRHVTVKPVFPSGLQWVRASVKTSSGRVSVMWKRCGEKTAVEVCAPGSVNVALDLPEGVSWRLSRAEE